MEKVFLQALEAPTVEAYNGRLYSLRLRRHTEAPPIFINRIKVATFLNPPPTYGTGSTRVLTYFFLRIYRESFIEKAESLK